MKARAFCVTCTQQARYVSSSSYYVSMYPPPNHWQEEPKILREGVHTGLYIVHSIGLCIILVLSLERRRFVDEHSYAVLGSKNKSKPKPSTLYLEP